jgi:hypothetical protein
VNVYRNILGLAATARQYQRMELINMKPRLKIYCKLYFIETSEALAHKRSLGKLQNRVRSLPLKEEYRLWVSEDKNEENVWAHSTESNRRLEKTEKRGSP